MDYPVEPVPGTWDHRGMDCATHGVNTPFARPAASRVDWKCVKCMLAAAEKWLGWRE